MGKDGGAWLVNGDLGERGSGEDSGRLGEGRVLHCLVLFFRQDFVEVVDSLRMPHTRPSMPRP